VNPLLGPLANYDGRTPTMALGSGSPAIDKGHSFGFAFDQRGEHRFDDPDLANATGGDGTDIGAYEVSEFRITAIERFTNDVRVSYTTALGRNYREEKRDDLQSGMWLLHRDNVPGTGGTNQTTVTNALSLSHQFYRVLKLP
jgi:hypothetical protein